MALSTIEKDSLSGTFLTKNDASIDVSTLNTEMSNLDSGDNVGLCGPVTLTGTGTLTIPDGVNLTIY
jgi:hypothetical protein